jgi:hypothetical protein
MLLPTVKGAHSPQIKISLEHGGFCQFPRAVARDLGTTEATREGNALGSWRRLQPAASRGIALSSRDGAGLVHVDGHGPYFAAARIAHIGCREAARADRAVAGDVGYRLHVDVDVFDPTVMPAVDSPDPGGLTPAELVELLVLLASRAIGVQVTVFDPDLGFVGLGAKGGNLGDRLAGSAPGLVTPTCRP